jgi:hypothetical protein
MDTIIAAPASCKVRAVICFLHAKGQSVAEIHHRLCRVYGDNVMSDNCVREWCRKYRDRCTDMHDEGDLKNDTQLWLMNSFKKSTNAWKTSFHDIKTFWRISTKFEDHFVSNCHREIGLPYFLCTVGTKTTDWLGCITWWHHSLKRDYKN